MEEDIKILADLIFEIKKLGVDEEKAQAIENLIKGYRKLEERNKELFETCCRYEDTLEHYEYKIFDELDDYIKLDEIRKLDKISIKGKKYISEMKVKEKIEELNKKEKEELKGLKGQDRYFVKQMYMYKRNILQELMKG